MSTQNRGFDLLLVIICNGSVKRDVSIFYVMGDGCDGSRMFDVEEHQKVKRRKCVSP